MRVHDDDGAGVLFAKPVLLARVGPMRKRKPDAEFLVVAQRSRRAASVLGALDETGVVTFRGGIGEGPVPFDAPVEIFTNFGVGPCSLGRLSDKCAWLPTSSSDDLQPRWALRRGGEGRSTLEYGDAVKVESWEAPGAYAAIDASGALVLTTDANEAVTLRCVEPSLKFALTWKARCSGARRTAEPAEPEAVVGNGKSFIAALPAELCRKVVAFAATGSVADARSLRAACTTLAKLGAEVVLAARVGDMDCLPRRQRARLLAFAATACPNLVSLKLRNVELLRDVELVTLKASPHLRNCLAVLNVGGCVQLTDDALDELKPLSALRSLNVANTAVSLPGLTEACAHWPALVNLNVYGKRHFFGHPHPDDDQPDHPSVETPDGRLIPRRALFALLANCGNLACLNARETGLQDHDANAALACLRPKSTTVLTGDRNSGAAPCLYFEPLPSLRD